MPNKIVWLPNEATARHYVRQCLKKRENAPKRIGIDYKVINISGEWETDGALTEQENQNIERNKT